MQTADKPAGKAGCQLLALKAVGKRDRNQTTSMQYIFWNCSPLAVLPAPLPPSLPVAWAAGGAAWPEVTRHRWQADLRLRVAGGRR